MLRIEFLYVVLAVAAVVPIVVMWRTRMISLQVHVEVPPEESAEPLTDSKRPAAQSSQVSEWEVSDAVATGHTPQPIRAASLIPLRGSQRPPTLSQGMSTPPPAKDEGLPVPV